MIGIYSLFIYREMDEVRVQGKRIFSNKVTVEIYRMLQADEKCIIQFKNLCHNFRFDIKGSFEINSETEVVYQNNDYGYKIKFIKKFNDWKCYSTPMEYKLTYCDRD
jgi:hypothetical protein